MKLNRSKKGFTLVEIMIVVVIIGLLAAMAIPAFQKVRRNSIGKAMINDARQIGSAVSQIATEFGAADGDTLAVSYTAASGLITNTASVLANGRTIPADELAKYIKTISKNYTAVSNVAFGAGEDTSADRSDDTAFTMEHAQVRPDELQGGATSAVAGNNAAGLGDPVAFDAEGKLI